MVGVADDDDHAGGLEPLSVILDDGFCDVLLINGDGGDELLCSLKDLGQHVSTC